jgi:hypothetical protein
MEIELIDTVNGTSRKYNFEVKETARGGKFTILRNDPWEATDSKNNLNMNHLVDNSQPASTGSVAPFPWDENYQNVAFFTLQIINSASKEITFAIELDR